jgi:hypothetical protein
MRLLTMTASFIPYSHLALISRQRTAYSDNRESATERKP